MVGKMWKEDGVLVRASGLPWGLLGTVKATSRVADESVSRQRTGQCLQVRLL